MLPVIGIGPAIKRAGLHVGDVIGHEMVAEFVALVDRAPQRAGLRIPCKAVGVAQPRGEDRVLPRLQVELVDRRAALLRPRPLLADIARRTDGHIKRRAIGSRDQAACPMVVVGRPIWQFQNRCGRRVDFRRAIGVGETHDRRRVGHVKIVTDKRHPERLVEALADERALRVDDAVSVGVAQKDDPVRALLRIRLGDEDVAVRQDIDPPRVVEVLGKARHREACRRPRRCASGPVHDLRRVARGAVGRRDQCRMEPNVGLGRGGGKACADNAEDGRRLEEPREKRFHGHTGRTRIGAFRSILVGSSNIVRCGASARWPDPERHDLVIGVVAYVGPAEVGNAGDLAPMPGDVFLALAKIRIVVRDLAAPAKPDAGDPANAFSGW